MRTSLFACIVALFVAVLVAPAAYGQEGGEGGEGGGEQEQPAGEPDQNTNKRGQTGMKFLQMSVDARASGMASAMTALENSSSIAMFYNPASMARLQTTGNVALNRVSWVADINYNAASAAYRPGGGGYGVFGISVVAVDYGTFYGAIRSNNESGYVSTGEFSPTAFAAGLGYAKALTDRFAVGGNLKYVTQDLTESVMGFQENESDDPSLDPSLYNTQGNSKSTVAVDFGVLYNTGFRSLNFAMSARNFSRELTYEAQNFELPLTLTIGISMDMIDFTSMSSDVHSLVLAVDAARPRDYYEHMNLGMEYTFMELLSLRAGYAFPTDEEGISLGAGLNVDFGGIGLGADYAYTSFGILGNVNRIGLQFSL